jgi:hypothetical protein
VSQIAKSEEQQPVKRMNVNIPLDLHNSFKSITAAQGKNMTDVLIQYIREYVGTNSTPKSKRRRK